MKVKLHMARTLVSRLQARRPCGTCMPRPGGARAAGQLMLPSTTAEDAAALLNTSISVQEQLMSSSGILNMCAAAMRAEEYAAAHLGAMTVCLLCVDVYRPIVGAKRPISSPSSVVPGGSPAPPRTPSSPQGALRHRTVRAQPGSPRLARRRAGALRVRDAGRIDRDRGGRPRRWPPASS